MGVSYERGTPVRASLRSQREPQTHGELGTEVGVRITGSWMGPPQGKRAPRADPSRTWSPQWMRPPRPLPCKAKDNLEAFHRFFCESQGQNLALTVLCAIFARQRCGELGHCRGTSLINNNPSLRPCSRLMPRALWWP